MDEKNIREIARGHGWPENEFLSDVKRLAKSYGYTEEGALAESQRVFTRKFGTKPKPVDPQTESRLRKIARNQGFDEGVFLKEYGRLIAEGRSDMDALSQTMKLFEKSAKVEKRPTLATFAPGHLEEPASPPKPKEKGLTRGSMRTEIDPELSSWLVGRGFARGPEGVAYTKTDKVGEDTVKLQIDFSDDARGMRYGYRLNIQTDPPEWKPDKALRDHPTLLEYKRFRDDLLTQRERAKTVPPPTPKTKPIEIPTGGTTKLALLPPEVEEAKEMERRDEALIIKEIKGEIKERVLSQYFYDFHTSQGRHVVGLSYAGVRAIIRKMGSIRIDELKLEEKKNGWLAICKAHDLRRNLDAMGVAYQPKYFPGGQENPFSLTVAASKAQRNAFRSFIEEKIVTEAYKAFLEERKKESGK